MTAASATAAARQRLGSVQTLARDPLGPNPGDAPGSPTHSSSPLWGGPTRPEAEREGGRRAWSTLPPRDSKSVSRRARGLTDHVGLAPAADARRAGFDREPYAGRPPPRSASGRVGPPPQGGRGSAPALCESDSPLGRDRVAAFGAIRPLGTPAEAHRSHRDRFEKACVANGPRLS